MHTKQRYSIFGIAILVVSVYVYWYLVLNNFSNPPDDVDNQLSEHIKITTLKPMDLKLENPPSPLLSFVLRWNDMARAPPSPKLPVSDLDAVIVVQTHSRIQYLTALIYSLQRVKYIENVVLIFSHDWYDPAINSVVQSIKFCKTFQIFMPYSIQLYGNTFPGTDVKDCPRDLSQEQALKMNCNNAQYPDSYGHYREAKYTAVKHHWWWKANFVLGSIPWLEEYPGPFMFIEEDHFLLPDSLHVLRKLYKFRQSEACKGQCSLIALGNYDKATLDADKVNAVSFRSNMHNMGLVIFRDFWSEILKCRKEFCTFDDYNWDWTLMHLHASCLSRPILVINPAIGRVLHTGKCGLHKVDCQSLDVLAEQKGYIDKIRPQLFPESMQFPKVTPELVRQQHTQNGGWSDPRDHQLCLNMVP